MWKVYEEIGEKCEFGEEENVEMLEWLGKRNENHGNHLPDANNRPKHLQTKRHLRMLSWPLQQTYTFPWRNENPR